MSIVVPDPAENNSSVGLALGRMDLDNRPEPEAGSSSLGVSKEGARFVIKLLSASLNDAPALVSSKIAAASSGDGI